LISCCISIMYGPCSRVVSLSASCLFKRINCDGSTHTSVVYPFVRALGCRVTRSIRRWISLRDPNRQNSATLSLVASPVNESAITAQVLVHWMRLRFRTFTASPSKAVASSIKTHSSIRILERKRQCVTKKRRTMPEKKPPKWSGAV